MFHTRGADVTDNSNGLFMTGLRLYREGHYVQAHELLTEARRKLPDSWHVAYRLGKTLVALSRYDEAIAVFDQAMKLPGSKRSFGIAAKGVAAYMRAADDGLYGKAVSLLEQAVQLEPGNGTCLARRGAPRQWKRIPSDHHPQEGHSHRFRD